MAWELGRYEPTWTARAAAELGGELRLPDVQAWVSRRLALLVSYSNATPRINEAMTLTPVQGAMAYHVLLQALVPGTLDKPKAAAIRRALIESEIVLLEAHVARGSLSLIDLAALPAGSIVSTLRLPVATRSEIRSLFETVPDTMIQTPFEMALGQVAARRVVMVRGTEPILRDDAPWCASGTTYGTGLVLSHKDDLRCIAVDRVRRFLGEVIDFTARTHGRRPGDPRVYELYALARNVFDRAWVRVRVVEVAPAAISLADALESSPRCVQSVWQILEKTGHCGNDYRVFITSYMRRVGVSSSELLAAVSKYAQCRGYHVAADYVRQCNAIYKRGLFVMSCDNLLKTRNGGLKCVLDIEDVAACKRECASQCGGGNASGWFAERAFHAKRRNVREESRFLPIEID
jgi:hypothetical protein